MGFAYARYLARVAVVLGSLAVGIEPRATSPASSRKWTARSRIAASSCAGHVTLLAECCSAPVVLGQEGHELVGAVAGAVFDEGADLEMLA